MRMGIKVQSFILVALALLLIAPMVSADLGTFKQGDSVNIRVLANCSLGVNITEVTSPVNTFVINAAMTKLGGQTYSYTFNNTSELGPYSYSWNNLCVDCSDGSCGNGFTITPTGQNLSTDQALVFIIILAFFILILLGSLYGLSRAEEGWWQILYICIAYVSMFCIFFISWLFCNNYLWDTPILASIFWIVWLILAIGFWPFIIIVSAKILIGDAVSKLADDYMKQGYSREDAISMAKRRRR